MLCGNEAVASAFVRLMMTRKLLRWPTSALLLVLMALMLSVSSTLAAGPPADPVAACIERASAALGTAAGDPVTRAGISQRIVDAMAAHGIQGQDQLTSNPDKAPGILLMLQQLCIERGV